MSGKKIKRNVSMKRKLMSISLVYLCLVLSFCLPPLRTKHHIRMIPYTSTSTLNSTISFGSMKNSIQFSKHFRQTFLILISICSKISSRKCWQPFLQKELQSAKLSNINGFNERKLKIYF